MTLNVGVTDDQFGQFIKKTMAIADRLGKSLPFEPVMRALQRIHDGEMRLRRVWTVPSASLRSFDPHEFLRTRAGLRIDNSFKKRILEVALPQVGSSPELAAFDLVDKASHVQVFAELRHGYAFNDVGNFSLCLAGMLRYQMSGKGIDFLCIHGGLNIFYVVGIGGELLAVTVCWNIDNREWVVGALSVTDDHRWDTGDRVFSCCS